MKYNTCLQWRKMYHEKERKKIKKATLTKLEADENLHPTRILVDKRADLERLCKAQQASKIYSHHDL